MDIEPYPDEMFEEAERRERELRENIERAVELDKIIEEAEKKALESLDSVMEKNADAFKQLAEIEREKFYRFFAVDYYGTGEGLSHWIKVCRNYPPYDGIDRELEEFKKFLGDSYYYPSIEELTEKEFMYKYAKLVPDHVTKMIERKDQPSFYWEAYFHVNYS